MTIIAFDGKELVSDSQMTLGDTVCLSPFRKIYTPEDDQYWEINGVKVIAFGLAGDALAIDYVKEKLQEGISHKTRFEDQDNIAFHALVINEKGELWTWKVVKTKERNRDRHELLPMLPPVAIGSGTDFALGVMAIGKGARLGVKSACKLDVGCGGNLQIFEVPPVPAVLSKRPPALETVQPSAPPAQRTDAEAAPTPHTPEVAEAPATIH